jgi:hypothetical protein
MTVLLLCEVTFLGEGIVEVASNGRERGIAILGKVLMTGYAAWR